MGVASPLLDFACVVPHTFHSTKIIIIIMKGNYLPMKKYFHVINVLLMTTIVFSCYFHEKKIHMVSLHKSVSCLFTYGIFITYQLISLPNRAQASQ